MAVDGSWVAFILFFFGWHGLLGSSDVVPLPEDPVVGQVAPAECLFYTSWTGTTRATAEGTCSTEQLYSDPRFLAYSEQIEQRIFDTILASADPQAGDKLGIEGALVLLKHLRSHAGSLYISEISANQNGDPEVSAGLVVRVEDDELDPVAQSLQSFLQFVPDEVRSSEVIGGEQFTRIDTDHEPPVALGMKDNYLVVGVGEGEAQRIIERLHGSVADWLVEAKKEVTTPRPASFIYFNIDNIFATFAEFLDPNEAEIIRGTWEAFGFSALDHISYGSGLDDRGAVIRGLLKLSGEVQGLLTLLDCSPLAAADFDHVSSASPTGIVFQLDPADALTAFLESCEHQAAPAEFTTVATNLRQQYEMARNALGFDLHKDLLASVGDTWRVFAQPGPNGLVNGWTISVDLSDPAKFTKIHDELLATLQKRLGDGGPVRVVSQRTEKAKLHSTTIIGLPFMPSWAIDEDQLLITTSPESLQRLLAKPAESTFAEAEEVRTILDSEKSIFIMHVDTAAVTEMVMPLLAQQLDAMPAGAPIDSSVLPPLEVITQFVKPSILAVERTKEGLEWTHRGTLPGINLGQTLPLYLAATLPAVGSARTAARSAQSVNNQKNMALAMHNFADARGAFPAGYSADEDGKPLLSWRVHILPFIGQQALYEQFHLDEPWDSEHNKKLIELMPDVFRSPFSNAEPGKTTYLGVAGADGVFIRPLPGGDTGVKFQDVTDGTSNTVMMVVVTDDRAIIWTRPADFAPQADDPRKGLLMDPVRGLSLGFVDGSVQSFPQDVADETLKSFFTKSGGEAIKFR